MRLPESTHSNGRVLDPAATKNILKTTDHHDDDRAILPAETPQGLQAVALDLVAHGLAVLPCRPLGKEPRTAHGVKDATTQAGQVRQWWADHPDDNPAIACGPSGLLVIDADKEGEFERLCTDQGQPVPEGYQVATAKGRHYWFRQTSEPIGNSNSLKSQGYEVDVRGAGGYVMAPEAIHVTGTIYTGTGPLPRVSDLPEAPSWLLGMLRGKTTRTATAPVGEPGQHAALGREMAAVALAKPGGRNEQLNRSAYNLAQLTGPGGLSESLVRASLIEVALAAGLVPAEVQATVESGMSKGQANRRKTTTSGDGLRLTPASEIKVEPVYWLWEGRLALGTLGLLAGREGLGKSTLAYWMAAQVTLGRLPGEFRGDPRSVMVCATEDSWSHTIVPRLIAAGADLTKVFQVEAEEHGFPVGLSLPRHTDQVQEAAEQIGAALLLLDPLMSRLDAKLDSHKDAEVRRALEPMVALADESQLAVLGLMHHNKSGSSDLSGALMGSRAFSAVARSVHSVIADPEDESGRRRVFGTWKNNLGRDDQPSLAFTIEGFQIPTGQDQPEVHTSRIVWGDEMATSIQEMHRKGSNPDRPKSAVDKAAEWLVGFLEQQPGHRCDAKAIYAEANRQGIPEGTLRVAKGRAAVLTSRPGVGRAGSEWYLADADTQEVLA